MENDRGDFGICTETTVKTFQFMYRKLQTLYYICRKLQTRQYMNRKLQTFQYVQKTPNILLGTLFDPCRLAYLTYTSNDCVRPHLTMNFPT